MFLAAEKFLELIEQTPLVSVDLLLRNGAGEVLLGRRKNPPAKGSWFVPGGRIRKNETIRAALLRICQGELNAEPAEAALLGVYDHLYPDNFLNQPGIGTHYVVLAFTCSLKPGGHIQPDSQHSDLRWWTCAELLANADVHENTKRYFDEPSTTFRF
ncbi:MAG TPA: GDP-mannose mannosyl hydrolase [Candidatus Saccharimonadales bacterium]|nr:GDP-mannose mannosyl hydrolase [Candidatus Saccharimonadales bacterium]